MDMFYDPLFPLAEGGSGDVEMDRMTDIGMLPDNGGSAAGPNGMAAEDGSRLDLAADRMQDRCGMCSGGQMAQDSIDPALLSLAMAFVPRQPWEEPYTPDVALSRGTIFPALDKPLLGEPPLSPQPRMEGRAAR